MGSHRRDPRNLVVAALTLMVLSAGTAAWLWARGEPFGPELGFFIGGLLVLGVGPRGRGSAEPADV